MPAVPKQIAAKIKDLGAVDVDEPVSGNEDPNLSGEQLVLADYIDMEMTRPKGASGKHKGKTHNQAFSEDLAYAALMARKLSLSSPWELSFRQFVIARLKAAARAEQTQNAIAEKTKRPSSSHSQNQRMTKGQMEPEGEDLPGWSLCSPPRTTSMAASSQKRVSRSPENVRMNTELAPEKRLDIQTKKALLQRELDLLSQLEQTSSNGNEDQK